MEKDNPNSQNVKQAIKNIQEQLAQKGPLATYANLKAQLNLWKEEKVTIAVTGKTATGKSTFINVVRGVNYGDPSFAKQGRGNTTKEPTYYTHPKNEKLRFCDLPGAATLQFLKAKYHEKAKLADHDVFLIFLDKVMGEDELWIANELLQEKKSFCFVRSKIDDDIRSTKQDGTDPDEILHCIRENIEKDIQSNAHLKRCLNLFLISCYDTKLGEWGDLMYFMENNLSNIKKEALLYSLPNLAADVIKQKYSQLKSRLPWVTAGCSLISALPIPFVDIAINMKIVSSEIKHYIAVFGLGLDEIEKLKGFDTNQLKCKTILDPNIDIVKLIASGLPKASATLALMVSESVADVVAPVVGSAVSAATTAKIVYDYLDRVLEDLKGDAYLVYGHISKLEK